MSRQGITYEDPANDRITSSQSVQMVRGYFLMLGGILGCMVMSFIGLFYAATLFGWLIGMIVGGVEAAGIIAGLAGYYYVAIMMPISQGSNLSAQCWESSSQLFGAWLISEQPLSEIPMDEEERLMPVRIPFGEFGKDVKKPEGSEGESEGLEVIEEVHVRCPNPKCENHFKEFTVDHGQIYHKFPFLQFKTFAYVMTPSNASFQQAVIISPCKIDSLRKITDLIFFKGFPAMASTTFLSLTRVFELDQHSAFGGPVYVVNFSSWHVEITQRLAGFTPAFMIPNQEQIIKILNLWGIREALQLTQQNATLKAQIESLQGSQIDFDKGVEMTAANIRKQEDLMDMFPRRVGMRWLKPKVLALIAATIIGVAVAVYLLTTYVFK